MIELSQVESWVRGGESETVEFKKTTGERREATQTICAFLNNRGGRVLFGVTPEGRVTGQMVSDKTLEDVAQELREIEPPVFPRVDRIDCAEGRQILVVFERVDDPLYPPTALREALANAVCHRDYSIGGGSISLGVFDNRLEITSSGILHFGLTPEALFQPHESLPWNPLIARVFYRRGIIESWGRGTIKIAELTTLAGLPLPEIEENAGCVIIRFLPTRYVPPQRVARDVTERQQRVLAFLGENAAGAAVRDIALQLGMESSPWTIREDLAILKTLGLVVGAGHGRGARWFLNGG